MKLRNKKTGEIGYIDNYETTYYVRVNKDYKYIHKADLFDEWEEYEDKEIFWFIAYDGKIHKDFDDGSEWIKELKEICNYFKTREEAEKAVEKLKAWKRLKDKDFQFHGYNALGCGEITFSLDFEGLDDENKVEQLRHDLDLLFGGEV